MDWTKLLNGVLNQIIRRFTNIAIDKGIDHFAGPGKSAKDMTPEEREQTRQAREMTERAKQARKVTRRLF